MRLSKTEQEIMEFFWGRQENQTFAGMLAYWNQERKKNWSKQTLNTYLRNLSAKGLVGRRKTIGKNPVFPTDGQKFSICREKRKRYCGKLMTANWEILWHFWQGKTAAKTWNIRSC